MQTDACALRNGGRSQGENSHHQKVCNGRPFSARRPEFIENALSEASRHNDAQEAIPGLPDHLVAEHIVRSEYFDDPADLARLPAVSRAMRDVVAEMGLRFEELDEKRAVDLGCLSTLQRMQRQGRLSRKARLCEAAARVGNLRS